MRLRLVPFCVIALLLLTGAAAIGQEVRGSTEAAVTLTVELELENGWRAVDPQTVFRNGEKVRFQFSSTFDGYLYVVNRSSSGDSRRVFPSRETGADNRVQAGLRYVIPAADGAFRIEGGPGFDVMYWIVTASPIGNWYGLDPAEVGGKKSGGAPSPGRLLPRCRDELFRARGECIDGRAGAAAVTNKIPSLVPGNGTLRARDLKFERQTNTTKIVAPAQLGAPFVYEFRLAHQ